MHARPLGRTGLHVSAVALGGAAFGQQYGPVSAATVADTVHAAVDAGVNLLDTSAYYGRGVSEQLLADALRGGWREKVLVCTKAGRLDRDVFDFSPAGMRACLDGSLLRLGTDYVDILLAHDIEFADDPERVFADTAGVLHDLKREGKCRFVGMSCYPLGLLRRAVERCQLDVIMSYCHFNLQNSRLVGELLPVADEHGVGVLNASPLAMGLLTAGGPPAWHPAGDDIKAACRRAADLCRDRGADLSTLGMRFCLAEERVACTVTGAANRAELETNLRAVATPPDAGLLAEVRAVLTPVHNKTWPSGRQSG